MANTVASQQEHLEFEYRSFLCGVCIGSPWVLLFPPTIKDMYVRVNTPISAPDQGTDKRSGVSLRVLYCGCSLLLVCLIRVTGWIKYRGSVSPRGSIKLLLFLLLPPEAKVGSALDHLYNIVNKHQRAFSEGVHIKAGDFN